MWSPSGQRGRGGPHFFLEVQTLSLPWGFVLAVRGDTAEGPGQVRLGRSWQAGAVSQSTVPRPEACDLGPADQAADPRSLPGSLRQEPGWAHHLEKCAWDGAKNPCPQRREPGSSDGRVEMESKSLFNTFGC